MEHWAPPECQRPPAHAWPGPVLDVLPSLWREHEEVLEARVFETRILHSLVFWPSFRCCQFVPFIQCFGNLLRAPMGCFYTAFIVFIQLSLISHTSPSHSFPLTFPSPSHDFPRSYLFALISMSHLPCMTSCCSWSVSWSRCRGRWVAFRRWVELLITSLPLFIELSSCIEHSCKKITEHLAVGNTFESIAIHEWDIWFLKCAEIISWVASGLSLSLSLIFCASQCWAAQAHPNDWDWWSEETWPAKRRATLVHSLHLHWICVWHPLAIWISFVCLNQNPRSRWISLDAEDWRGGQSSSWVP